MKNKIVLITVYLLLITSTVMGAPLTDYSQGRVSLDLMLRNSQNNLSTMEGSFDFDRKFYLEPSVTIGLGNNFAFQYRNISSKSGTTPVFGGGSGTLKKEVNEFNILYKLGANVSAFAGAVSTKGITESDAPKTLSGKKNTWQLGLVGYTPLADKVTAYALVGAGSDYTNFEIGLSYAFTKNLEFNVMSTEQTPYFHIRAQKVVVLSNWQ